ncbi:hypothetical protein TWF281_000462 [Arthrobotrys megalospora]
MPPKRAASASSGTAPKKPRSGGSNSSGNGNELPAIPLSNRWATVSGSENLDDDYKVVARNPVRAYIYICLCQAPFKDDEEEGDGWEDVMKKTKMMKKTRKKRKRTN